MKYMISMMLALALPDVAYAQTAPVGALGRYIIVASAANGGMTFLLDTATGKTWQIQRDSSRESDPLMWVPLTRVDDPGEIAAFLNHYPIKANSNPKPQNSN